MYQSVAVSNVNFVLESKENEMRRRVVSNTDVKMQMMCGFYYFILSQDGQLRYSNVSQLSS